MSPIARGIITIMNMKWRGVRSIERKIIAKKKAPKGSFITFS